MACETDHKEGTMSTVAANPPAHTPAIQAQDADHTARDREARPSRLWLLLEALAYAGASIDPASALAAQRFARLRDQELRDGRW
jgi:hypothetical protein